MKRRLWYRYSSVCSPQVTCSLRSSKMPSVRPSRPSSHRRSVRKTPGKTAARPAASAMNRMQTADAVPNRTAAILVIPAVPYVPATGLRGRSRDDKKKERFLRSFCCLLFQFFSLFSAVNAVCERQNHYSSHADCSCNNPSLTVCAYQKNISHGQRTHAAADIIGQAV